MYVRESIRASLMNIIKTMCVEVLCILYIICCIHVSVS